MYLPNYKKTKYLYNKADHVKIPEYLNDIDWVGEFKDKNVQDNFTIFLRAL